MTKMKNSGYDWIGDIPYDWKLRKAKYIFRSRNQRGNDKNLELLSPTQNYGVIPQRLYEEYSGMVAVKLKADTNLNMLKTVHVGDFCISLRSFQGGFEYSTYEGVVSPAYQLFYPYVEIDDRYYKYLFKEKGFIGEMNSHTMSLRDGKNIAFSDFGDTYIPFPEKSIQRKIADYLDNQCAKIDAISEDIQKQIRVLEDYRKSIISEAVTKGLDKSVPMKDSGIEWIGKIPEDWIVAPVKYYADYNKHTLSDGTANEFEFDYVDIGSVTYANGIEATQHMYFKDAPSRARRIVKKGDVILSTVRTYLKAVASIPDFDTPMIVSTGFVVFEAHNDMDDRFLSYAVKSEPFVCTIEKNSTGVSYPAITSTGAANTKIVVPDIESQRKIANYLDYKCGQINNIINLKVKQLDVLKEYRQSIIYEYVTGKKQVKEN